MIDDDFHNVDGMAHCEGVPLAEIAAQVGTPTYVYSTSAMTRRARALQEAVGPAGDVLVAYAVKANPAAAVLATFARQGLGARR